MAARFIALLLAATLLPSAAHAADLDGASLAWPWLLPFAGILLTIALGPLLFARCGTITTANWPSSGRC